jgi:hypothetical protein
MSLRSYEPTIKDQKESVKVTSTTRSRRRTAIATMAALAIAAIAAVPAQADSRWGSTRHGTSASST